MVNIKNIENIQKKYWLDVWINLQNELMVQENRTWDPEFREWRCSE